MGGSDGATEGEAAGGDSRGEGGVGLLVIEVDLPQEVATEVEACKVEGLGGASAAEGDELAGTDEGGARRTAGGEVAEVHVLAGEGEEVEEGRRRAWWTGCEGSRRS